MELGTTREATSCEATRYFPSILWNPKVRYRIHNSFQLVLILSQINPVHIRPIQPRVNRRDTLFKELNLRTVLCVGIKYYQALLSTHEVSCDN
jgi:hypothetical protein